MRIFVRLDYIHIEQRVTLGQGIYRKHRAHLARMHEECSGVFDDRFCGAVKDDRERTIHWRRILELSA